MDSVSNFPIPPTNLLTYLLGQPETTSFDNGLSKNPVWFSTSLPFLVSAKSPIIKSVDFDRLKHLVKSLASGLRKNGLQPGDRLLLISPENIYIPVMMLATIAAGGIFVGCRSDFSKSQQVTLIKHCEPAFVLSCTECERFAADTVRFENISAQIFHYDDDSFDLTAFKVAEKGGRRSWLELMDDDNAASFRWSEFHTKEDLETTALIVYTTGSTSEPKGVELTHRTLLLIYLSYQRNMPASNSQESWIHNYSSAFAAAPSNFLGALSTRNRLVVYDFPDFDFNTFLSSILLQKCSVVIATKQAVDAIAATKIRLDDSRVLLVIVGGAVIPQATRQAVNKFFGRPVIRVSYALTETGGAISVDSPSMVGKPSSCVGKLLPHVQGMVVDDNGNSLKEGEPGHLRWKTPAAAKGYWRNPILTRKVFGKDGWIESGDIGYLDSEGQLHITGRAKEVLKVRGRPVTPDGIEATLMELPGVQIVCVVGIQDMYGEELPKAYIVRTDNDPAIAPLSEQDVHAFMKEKMSEDNQLTGGVQFVSKDWLPYGGNGKIMKKEVAKRAQEEWDVNEEDTLARQVEAYFDDDYEDDL